MLEKYVADGVMTDSEGHNIFDYLPAGRGHIIPENNEELADLLVALGNLGGGNRWMQLAYPAARACVLYEPTSGGKAIAGLAAAFAKGKWYLHAPGDEFRLYVFFRNSRALSPADTGTPTSEFSDEDNPLRPTEPTDARRPFYANLQKRSKEAKLNCPISVPAQAVRWSSVKGNLSYAWHCNFYDGGLGSNGKYDRFRVRPVVAFNFAL